MDMDHKSLKSYTPMARRLKQQTYSSDTSHINDGAHVLFPFGYVCVESLSSGITIKMKTRNLNCVSKSESLRDNIRHGSTSRGCVDSMRW